MTEFKMLDELIHYCTKCKLNLNHRVVLLEDDQPKRVLCLTCRTERQWRSTPSASGPRRAARASSVKAKTDTASEWKMKLSDKSKTPKPYPASGSYAADDLIYHKSFGLGLVVHLIPPDKMQIYFDDGLKVLKQNF